MKPFHQILLQVAIEPHPHVARIQNGRHFRVGPNPLVQRLAQVRFSAIMNHILLALPHPKRVRSALSYRTAIVTALEVTPPIAMVTGTALPFADPAGTCTFT